MYMHPCTYIHTCTIAHTCRRMYTYRPMCVYVHMYTCIYIYACIYMLRGLGGVVGLTLPMARADRGSRPVHYLPCSDLGQVVNLSLSVAYRQAPVRLLAVNLTPVKPA